MRRPYFSLSLSICGWCLYTAGKCALPYILLCVLFPHTVRIRSTYILQVDDITRTPVYPVLPPQTSHSLSHHVYVNAICAVLSDNIDKLRCNNRLNSQPRAVCTSYKLPNIALHPTTSRLKSVIAQVFGSYKFGHTSPILIYRISVLRAFPVVLVLLSDAHGFNVHTTWLWVFTSLDTSTEIIYTKRSAFDHSGT